MFLRTWRRPTYPPRGVTVLQPATCPRSRASYFWTPKKKSVPLTWPLKRSGPLKKKCNSYEPRAQPAASASVSLQNQRSPFDVRRRMPS